MLGATAVLTRYPVKIGFNPSLEERRVSSLAGFLQLICSYESLRLGKE